MLFKRFDGWKVQHTQTTNRANGVLTSYGFTVFRLVPINSSTGFKIIQAVIDGHSATEIAALHRTKVKRAETEKCATVTLPEYLKVYLREVLNDVSQLNQRILSGEAELLTKIDAFLLVDQISLMCSVPGMTKLLALRVIAEMGANYYQRYFSAKAFTKAIGVVPSNEVSGGKLLKRRASHGNKRLKFHLLSAAKAYAIHGKSPLRGWFDAYRGRSNYSKAISALARCMAEALWWVMVQNKPYRYWKGEAPSTGAELIELGDLLVNHSTGEVLDAHASMQIGDV